MVSADARNNLEFLIFNRSGLCLCHIDLQNGEVLPTTSVKPEEITNEQKSIFEKQKLVFGLLWSLKSFSQQVRKLECSVLNEFSFLGLTYTFTINFPQLFYASLQAACPRDSDWHQTDIDNITNGWRSLWNTQTSLFEPLCAASLYEYLLYSRHSYLQQALRAQSHRVPQ